MQWKNLSDANITLTNELRKTLGARALPWALAAYLLSASENSYMSYGWWYGAPAILRHATRNYEPMFKSFHCNNACGWVDFHSLGIVKQLWSFYTLWS
jgi:hypothetical protein